MKPRGWQVVSLALLVVLLGVTGCAKLSALGENSEGGSASSQAGAGGPDGGTGGPGGPGSYGAGGRGSTAGGESGAMRPSPSAYSAMPDLKDIHFEFDRADILPEAAKILEVNAGWLKANPRYLVLIEGHTDERGTNEYNLALGERRARASRNFLVSQGVPARRISVISYGEERPTCRQSAEDCWAQNRRAHFGVNSR
jgi:peptidoglycan-associated lipoprotein